MFIDNHLYRISSVPQKSSGEPDVDAHPAAPDARALALLAALGGAAAGGAARGALLVGADAIRCAESSSSGGRCSISITHL